ncbi:radical SAM protein [Candidatus Sumerlaeota bacterium]|nr:radical SAM protein [Candidatus Sumerlaeota bacterium]
MSHLYYIPRPNETRLESYFRRRVLHRVPVPVFPQVIQIQTMSGCNARCVFCPNGRTKSRLSMGTMDWEMFTALIDECAQYEMKRISPFLMNEPLLDRDLGRKIRYVTDRKPKGAITKINSNASLLDEEMGRALIESGLDRISFSVHGIEPAEYEKSMGNLHLEETLERIDRFLDLKRSMKADLPRVQVTMVKTKIVEDQIPKIHDYWSKRGVRVNIRGLGNRANSDIGGLGINVGKWELYRSCTDLFLQSFVIWDGTVVLCCVDWERSTVLGSLRESSLYDIWNGEKAVEIRRRFLAGDVKGLLCGRCTREPSERKK